MTKAPIRWWREPVDADHFALVAFCEFTSYGNWYAVSFYLLVPMAQYHHWQLNELAEKHFIEQLKIHHSGHMPSVYEHDHWRRTH